MHFSGVTRRCPHCEKAIGIMLDMCAGCENRRAREAAESERRLAEWAVDGLEQLGAYLARRAAFEVEYPDPD
jgi:hypothetical protein